MERGAIKRASRLVIKKTAIAFLMMFVVFSLSGCFLLEMMGFKKMETDPIFYPSGEVTLEGEGTAQAPYLIEGEEDFDQIRNKTAYYLVKNDISISSATKSIQDFYGVLDGGGYEITSSKALFRRNYGIIKNVNARGTIVEKNDGTVFGCKVAGGIYNFAGLVTDNELSGIIDSCYTSVSASITHSIEGVSGIVEYGSLVGGINKGRVKNCGSFDTVTLDSSSKNRGAYVSGLVFDNRGRIENCFSNARIVLLAETSAFASSSMRAAGLVMTNTGTIKNCYFAGKLDVSAKNIKIGGLIAGGSNSIIENCYVSAEYTVNGSWLGFNNDADVFALGKHSVTKCFVDSTMKESYSAQEGGVVSDDLTSPLTFAGWSIDIWQITAGLKPTLIGLKAGGIEL